MRYSYLLLPCLLLACSPAPSGIEQHAPAADTIKATPADTITAVDSTNASASEDYATYYVVIADTGMRYAVLDQKMYRLKKQMKLPVDTMGRHYNRKKDLIALADDDEDELYAGDYYPRRDVGEFLSLEYLKQYQDNSREKTIALVAGIYETAQEATHALGLLKPFEPKAYLVKSVMFIGCLH